MADDAQDATAIARIAATLGAGPASAIVGQLLFQRGVCAPEAAVAFLQPRLSEGLRPPEAFGLRGVAVLLAEAIVARRPLLIATGTHLDARLAGVVLAAGLRGLRAEVCWSDATGEADGVALAMGRTQALPSGGARCAVADDGALLWSADAPSAEAPICLSGLAWYLLVAIRQALREQAVCFTAYDVRELLDVVALATSARQVSLRAENRVLMHAGLDRMNRTPRPLLRALREALAQEVFTARVVEERLVTRIAGVAARGAAWLEALFLATELEQARAAVAAIELGRANDGNDAPSAANEAALSAVDAEISLAEVTPRFGMGLSILEPFGIGNDEPLFRSRGAKVEAVRLVGDPIQKLAKLRLRQDGRTLPALLRGPAVDAVFPGQMVDADFRIRTSGWQGQPRVELRIERIFPAGGVLQASEIQAEIDLLTLGGSPAT